ncbi:MAG: hypothetical protein GW875_11935 [Deltaproteobacteria bacterium]|nr:hypothetical protein [Deltaproteobacteria bacterium]
MRLLFVLILLLVITGCTETKTYYLGARENPQRITPIHTLPTGTLQWKDLYIKVNYQLSQETDMLKITGKLTFADYPKINLARFKQMVLSLYLLDDQGRVVNYAELIKPLGNSFDEEFPFEKKLTLHPETSALSFGYDIRAYDETGTGSFYWQQPLRNH